MTKTKLIKSQSTDIVAQSNSLVEAPKNLNVLEYRLFLLIVAKINPLSNDLPIFRISAEEFAKITGVNPTYVYRDLQRAADLLLTRYATIHYPDINETVKTNLTQQIRYLHGNGIIEIKLSEEIKPFILNLKEKFTQFKLSNVIHLSSVYAIRLYELLKSQELLTRRIFSIQELRMKLGIDTKKYIRFADLRNRVLDIAVREINTKTDLYVTVSFKKTKQKITSIKFDIVPNNQESATHLDTLSSVKRIMNLGYSFMKALDVFNSTDGKTLNNAINAVSEQIDKGNSRRPKAMLQTAIKEHWSPSKKYTTKKNS